MKPTAENGGYRKDYPLTRLILGNGAIALWIGLGSIACALFYPLAALLFFGVAVFLVFYEIGKRGCITCYYCKTCTIGMGKLPDLFFRRGGTANVNKRALQFFVFTYLLLTVVPTVLLVISLIQEVTAFKAVLLAAILAFSVYTGTVRAPTLIKSRGRM